MQFCSVPIRGSVLRWPVCVACAALETCLSCSLVANNLSAAFTGDTDLMLGYDAGSKNAFAGARGRFDIEGKPISLGALWFQKGNHVTLEGKANFNALSPFPRLWAT